MTVTRFSYMMVLACALAFAGFVSAETETGQPADGTLKLTPRLALGDRFVLEITKTKTRTGRPEMGRTKGFQVVDVEIITGGGKNVLLSWTPRRTGVIGPDGKTVALPPQAAGLATMYDGVQMLFELSPEGELIGLKNFDRIRPLMTRMIDKTLAAMNPPPQEKARLRQAVEKMLSSRKAIEQICSKEITLLLALARLELNANTEVGFDRKLPMPAGGGVIPARLVAKVKNLDRTAGRATVTTSTKMDPREAAKATLALMRAMARKTGRPVPTERDLPKMNIRDKGDFVVDLKTNLPLSVEYVRTTAVGPNKRVDTIEIVRKPARATTRPAGRRR